MTTRLRGSIAAIAFAAFLHADANGAGPSYPFAPVSCVEFPKVDPGAVGKNNLPLSTVGNLAIIEFGGDYARGVSAGRQQIAQSYFREHQPVDFLVVFTTFDFPKGDALAFYNGIKNDVSGIGLSQFNNSAAFGSTSLQGYIDMASVAGWQLNPRLPEFDQVADALAHEFMHRYGVFLRWNDGSSLRTDLIGRDQSHWSFFVDSDASVMLGNDWRTLPSGQFESIDVMHRYSDLDLYAAGLIAPQDVRPTALIINGTGNANNVPRRGATTGGQAINIAIQQVIAAEGPRSPASSASQRDYRFGWVLLKRPNQTIAADVTALMESARVAFETEMAARTGGRATFRIGNALKLPNAGRPTVLTGSPISQQLPSAQRAAAWLRSRQATDGSFRDKPETALRDTAVAVRALEELDPTFNGLPPARAWLLAQTTAVIDADDQYWLLQGLDQQLAALLGDIANQQRGDGAFGLIPLHNGSPIDTGLIVQAARRRNASLRFDDAQAWLLASANNDGSHGVLPRGRGRVMSTLAAASAMPASVLGPAKQWLRSRQYADGGLGDGSSRVDLSAYALQLPNVLGGDALNATALVQYLLTQQGDAGDWQGSVYTTAQAALAVARFGRPNLRTRGTITLSVDEPTVGDTIEIRATIENVGNADAGASSYRWYRGAPDQGGQPLGPSVALPAITAGGSAQAIVNWVAVDGASTIVLVIDDANVITESNEADNRAERVITAIAPPAIPELSVSSAVAVPAALTVLPASLRIDATVRNAGLQPASNVLIALYRDGVAQALAETRINISAQATASVQLTTQVDSGPQNLRVVVDPDNAIAEANENNNARTLSVPLASAVDLEVTADDIVLDTDPALVNEDVRWRVTVRNRGTSESPTAVVRGTVVVGANRIVLPEVSVAPGPGEALQRNFVWRASAAGPVQFEVQIDPANQVTEANENNNLAMSAALIGTPDQADLSIVPGSLSHTPSPALEGAALRITATIRNSGASATPAFVARAFLGDPRQGAAAIGSVTVDPGLAAGAERSVEINSALLTLAGDQTLYVLADATQQVVERSETNNFQLLPIAIRRLPDLATSLAGLSLTPSAPATGQPAELRVQVRNLGEQPAAAFVVRLLDGTTPVGNQTIAGLAPGATGQAVFAWTFAGGGTPPSLGVLVDADSAVAEGNESNNRVDLPLSTQNSVLFASHPVFSPNGDGVRDRTDIGLRWTGAGGPTAVEIRRGDGKVVRRFAPTQVGDPVNASVAWDGRNLRGQVVPDGVYRVLAISASGEQSMTIVVDNNRATFADAVGTSEGALINVAQLTGVSLDQWQTPPDRSPWRLELFTRTTRPSGSGLPEGIYRFHPHDREVVPLISSAWVRSQLDLLGGGLNWFAFPTSGDSVVFELSKRIAGNQTEISHWRISLDTSDAPVRLSPPAIGLGTNLLGSFDANHLALRRQTSLLQLNLQSGEITTISSNFSQNADKAPGKNIAPVIVGPTGVLVDGRTFFPRGGGATVALPISNPIATSVDGAQVMHLAASASGTRVVLTQSAGGTSQVLAEHALERIGNAGDFWADIEAGGGGFASIFVPEFDRFVFGNGFTHEVLVVSRTGQIERRWELPRFARENLYVANINNPGGNSDFLVDTIYSVRRVSFRDVNAIFDPYTSAIDIEQFEQVSGPVFVNQPGYWQLLDGVRESVTLREDGSSAVTGRCGDSGPGAWIRLFDLRDVRLYTCASASGSPFPARLRMRDGASVDIDGRVSTSSGLRSDEAWLASLNGVRGISDDDQAVVDRFNERLYSQTINLSARLAAESEGRTIRLSGVAVDRNLDYYELEWARAAQTPETWFALTPAIRNRVERDEFLTWVPPEPGDYRFRLTAVDLAGNRTQSFARARSNGASPITFEQLAPKFISPNGDSVQDQAVLAFRVNAPVSTEFVVFDSDGNLIRNLPLVYGAADLGPKTQAWDGRSNGGVRVPDGDYRIGIDGQFAKVVVDTVFPEIGLDVSPWYATDPPAARFGCFDAHHGNCELQKQIGGGPIWTVVARSTGCEESGVRCFREKPLRDPLSARWRLVSRDRAGNQAISEWVGPLAPAVVMWGINEAVIGDSPFYRDLDLQQPDFNITQPPNHGALMTGSELLVRVAYPNASSGALQARAVGSNAWITLSDQPASALRTCSAQPPQECDSIEWRMPVDLSSFVAGSIVDLRVLARANGDQFSNRLRVIVGGIGRPRVVTGIQSDLLARLRARYTQPAAQGVSYDEFLAEEWLSGPLPISPAGTTILRKSPTWPTSPNQIAQQRVAAEDGAVLFALATCGASRERMIVESRIRSIVVRSPDAELDFAGQPESCGVGSGSDEGIAFGIAPVKASACGDGPTGQLRVRVFNTRPLSIGTQQRISIGTRAASANQIATELLSIPLPGSSQGFDVNATFAIPPTAAGQLMLRAEAIGSAGSVGRNTSVPIDRVPPNVRITAPASGSRICATDQRLVLSGAAADNIGYALALQWGAGAAPSAWFAASGEPPQGLGSFDFESQFVAPGSLVSPDRAGVLWAWGADNQFLPDGLVSLRLASTDWSGALVCATESIVVDSKVAWIDWQEPDRILDSTNRIVGVSAVGDQAYRVARAYRRPRELLTVRGTLHATSLVGGQFIANESTLRELLPSVSTNADVTLVWDGRVGGSVPPDGYYTMRLTAGDSCQFADRADTVVLLDNTPPAITVSSPSANATLTSPVVALAGSIRDVRLTRWQVEFGVGAAPTAWTEVASGTNEVNSASLGSFARGSSEGPAVIRVSAVDRLGNRSEVLVPVVLAPRNRLIDRAAAPVAFSPNQDQRGDVLPIEVVLARESSLTVRVLATNGTVLRTLANSQSAAAGPVMTAWDGKDTAGSVLPEAGYRVEVVATDPAQSFGSESAVLDTRIDVTPPTLALVSPSAAHMRQGFIEWQVAEVELATAVARLLAMPASTLIVERTENTVGSHLLRNSDDLNEGLYRIDLEAVDVAGNRATLTRGFRLDRTAPSASLMAPVNDAVLPRAATSVRGVIDDVDLANWRLELVGASTTVLGQGQNTIPTEAQIFAWTVSQPDGPYQLRLVATDGAGNSTTQSVDIDIDGTPPTVRIDQPTADRLLGQRFDVMGQVADAHLLDYRIAVATAAQPNDWVDLAIGNAVVTGLLGALDVQQRQGPLRLRLTATDRAGLSASVERAIRVDSEAPGAPTGLAAVVLQNRDVRLNWTAPAANDIARYELDRWQVAIGTTATTEYLDLNVPEGRPRYRVRAVDLAGNAGPWSVPVDVVIDRTPPTVGISAPNAAARVRGLLRVFGFADAADDFASYALRADIASAVQTLASGQQPVSGQLGTLDTSTLAEGAAVRLVLSAQDTRANQASVQVDVSVDNQAPATPTGLAVAAIGPDVRAQWNANTEPDLLGYLLYRDAALVNGPSALPEDLRPFRIADTQFLDRGVGDGLRRWRIAAIDTAGNVSPLSAPQSLTIDQGPPDIVIESPSEGASFERAIDVLAVSADQDLAEVRFEVRAPGAGAFAPLGAPLTSRPFAVQLDATALGNYQVRAIARDVGNASTTSAVRTLVHVDETPPPRVTGLLARARGSSVELSWTAVTASDLAGYQVRGRGPNGAAFNPPVTTATTAVHTDAELGRWTYEIVSRDASGNEAPPSVSDGAEVFSVDLLSPRTPTSLTELVVEGSSGEPGEVRASVQDSAGTRQLPLQTTSEIGRFELPVASLAQGATAISVFVVNGADDHSTVATLRFDRGDRPAAPTGLAAIVNATNVQLNWTANAPAPLAYRLTRSDSPQPAAVVVPGLSVTAEPNLGDPNAVIDGDIDTVWSAPILGSEVRGSYLELEAVEPFWLSQIEIDFGTVGSRASEFDVMAWSGHQFVRLATGATDTANAAITLEEGYRTTRVRIVPRRVPWTAVQPLAIAEVRVKALPLIATTSYLDTPAGGRHRYRVRAISTLGLEGAASPELQVAVGDVDPPDAPVLSGSVLGSIATLSWTAPTAPDVAAYRLQRDSATLTTRPAAQQRTYDDGPLPNGQYRYRVIAVDGAGNDSEPSNEVVLSINALLPGVPQAVMVTAPSAGGRLQIDWQPGAGSAPVRYRLRRAAAANGNYSVIAEPTNPSYLDQPLANGVQQFYTVAAIDAAGNVSAPSAPVSGTPRDADPPAAPQVSYPILPGVELETAATAVDLCAIGPASRHEWTRDETAFAERSTLSDFRSRSLQPAYESTPVLSDNGGYGWWNSASQGLVELDVLGLSAVASGVRVVTFDARDGYFGVGADSSLRRYARQGASEPVSTGLAEVIDARASTNGRWLLLHGRLAAGDTASLYWYSLDTAQRTPIALNVDGIDTLEVDALGARAIARVGTSLHLITRSPASVQLLHANADGAAPTLTANGDQAWYVRRNNNVDEVWQRDPAATSATLFASFNEPVLAVRRIANERVLVVLANDVYLYSTASNSAPLATTQAGETSSAQISRSGRAWLDTRSSAGSTKLLDPPGYGCLRSQPLAVGSRRYSAMALDESGNRSLPAASILIARTSAAGPDLAIDSASIAFDPTVPAIGQPFVARALVRNLGTLATPTTTLRLSLQRAADPPVIATATVPAVAPGGVSLVSVPLAAQSEAGNYTVVASVDPDNAIVELSEENNRANRDLWLAASSAPQLSLSLAQTELPPAGQLAGRVDVRAGNSDLNARLRLTLEEMAGEQIAVIADEAINALTAGTFWLRAFQYDTSSLLAGTYRVRARLNTPSGTPIGEVINPITILADRQFELSLTPPTSPVAIGQLADLAIRVRYRSGNVLVPGAQLRLRVSGVAPQPVFTTTRTLGTLQPGFELQQTVRVPTAGLDAGNYVATVELLAGTDSWSAQAGLSLIASGASDALTGTIASVPAPMVVGNDATLQYTISNPATSAQSDVSVRVRLRRATDLSVIAQATPVIAIGAQSMQSGSLAIPASALGIENLVATLEARLSGANAEWRMLALRSVQVVDGIAPVLTPLAPGAFAPSPTPLLAQALDAHSTVQRVEARIDQGEWLPLGAQGAARYGRTVADLVEGPHQVQFRAADRWGNEVESAATQFIVDRTPPTIVVTGVVDGALLNVPVTPVVSINDLNLDTQQITLDGAPFASGTTVSSDGPHVLVATAVDRAGNRTEVRVRFTIDRIAPTVAFASPANNANVNGETVDVVIASEANAAVRLSVGAYVGNASANAQGQAPFASVPLVPGANTLSARATDLAGNQSAPVSITVNRIDDPTSVLQGAVQVAPSTAEPGTAIVATYTVNYTGNAPRSGQVLRMQVRNASGTVLATLTRSVDFAVGGAFNEAVNYPTGAYPLAPLSFALDADSAAGFVNLATGTANLVDLTAPNIAIAAPVAGAVLRSPLQVRANVSDARSTVALVVASIDGGPDIAMVETATAGLYESTAQTLIEGAHQVRVRARDSVGNERTSPPMAFVTDETAPTIVIGGVANGQLSRDPLTPTIAITDPHPGTSTVRLNGSAFVSGTTINASGNYRLEVSATDQAGNIAQRDISFRIDRDPPAVVISQPVANAIVLSDRIAVIGSTEALSSLRLDVGSYFTKTVVGADGTFAIPDVPLVPGSNVLRARATDEAGNVGPETALSVEYRPNAGITLTGEATVAPDPAAHGGSTTLTLLVRNPNPGQARAIPMRFSVYAQGSSAHWTRVGFDVTLPAGGELTRAETLNLAGQPLGNQRVVLEGFFTDSAGAQAWLPVAERLFAISDQAPPDATILTPAAQSYHSTAVSVRVRATDALSAIALVEARLDNGFALALAPVAGAPGEFAGSLPTTTEGLVELRVRAVDAAGNQRTTAPLAIRVDRTAPAITLSGIPSSVVNTAVTPQAQVQDASPITLTARLNGQLFQIGTAISAEGSYALEVLATDAAGNASTAKASFAIDTTPPAVAIGYPPPGTRTKRARIEVLGTMEAGASVSVLAPGYSQSAPRPTSTTFGPLSVPLLVGDNPIQAEARDAAGNTARSSVVNVLRESGGARDLVGDIDVPASLIVTADLPVNIQVQNLQSAPINGLVLRLRALRGTSELAVDSRTVNLAANDFTRYSLSWPTTAWRAGRIDIILERLVGSTVEVLDRASVDVLDRTPPSIAIVVPTSGQSLSLGDALQVRASDVHSDLAAVEIRIDTGDWTATVRGTGDLYTLPLPRLTAGPHELTARATDAAGNVASAGPVPFTARAILPLSITRPTNGATLPPGLFEIVGSTEALAQVTVRRRGSTDQQQANADASGTFRMPGVNLPDGEHNFDLQARNTAGATSEVITLRLVGVRAVNIPVPLMSPLAAVLLILLMLFSARLVRLRVSEQS